MALDPAGDVYVTGQSQGSGTGYDIATVKYASLDGSQVWVNRFNSTGAVNDMPVGVVVDNHFNVFVAGQAPSAYDYVLLRYQYGTYAPAILTPPQDCSALVGGSIVLNVSASGSEPMHYQWAFNGTAIAGASDSTLILTNLTSADAGAYSVRVENPAGTVTSTAGNLYLLTAQPILAGSATNPALSGNGFAFQVSIAPGATYVVEASSNLKVWTPIATNTAITASTAFVDPAAKNFTMRFYRVVVR
jgi:Immunoglobulin I-set domain